MNEKYKILIGLLAAPGMLAGSMQADEPKPMNVLILYADDMGYGDLGIQNAKSKIPTPNLDQLAHEGLRFADGHSSSGICTPSRYAMLTGRHHWRDFHGIVGPMGGSRFKPERLTMPEMFQAKGYTTAAIGKWHLGWDWGAIRKPDAKKIAVGSKKAYGPEAYDWSMPIPDGPLAHGFDRYFGDTVINFPPYCWIENDRVLEAPDTMMDTKKWKAIKEGSWECRPGPMVTGWNPYENIPTLTERGVDYITSQAEAEKPWFLYFALPSPHAPIIPNDRFDGTSEAGAYGDFVVETDDACGQLLKALKDSGQEANTVVFFSADNGPEYYAYSRDKKYDHWSSEPFRGLKQDIYEGGHHVPFLLKWPGVTQPGGVSDHLVSQIDLMATFAEYLGFSLPDDSAEDSHDLTPVLKGEGPARTFCVQNTWKGQYALRSGDWLLIDAKSGYQHRSKGYVEWEAKRDYPEGDKSPYALYNLKEDIGQRHNLANAHPDKVAEMKTLLEKVKKQGYSAPRLTTISRAK